MLAWLSVVMRNGRNDSQGVEGEPVYLKRSLPAALTTTTARASRSDTQISKFLFSLRIMKRKWKELPGSTSVARQNQTKCLMCQRSLLAVEGHTVATVAPRHPVVPRQSPPGLSTDVK
ncbi:uncharacterized protein LOC144625082 [Crassostrea virginica]